jgi:hypothetical protein
MVSVIDFTIYSVKEITTGENKISFFGNIQGTNLTKSNTLPKNWLSFIVQKAKLFFNNPQFFYIVNLTKSYISVVISGNEILTISLSEFLNLPLVVFFSESVNDSIQLFINQVKTDSFEFKPEIILKPEQTFDFILYTEVYIPIYVSLTLKGILKKEIIG